VAVVRQDKEGTAVPVVAPVLVVGVEPRELDQTPHLEARAVAVCLRLLMGHRPLGPVVAVVEAETNRRDLAVRAVEETVAWAVTYNREEPIPAVAAEAVVAARLMRQTVAPVALEL
jgi:hypothetical protein